MNVFARYFTENGHNFRLNTVLQFGDSWDIIGGAVLINPGSARPIGDITPGQLIELSKLTHHESDWKVFSADPTMRQLEKIFNGWYIGKNKELNGVIILSNLFNLRDKNLRQALEMRQQCTSDRLFTNQDDLNMLRDIDNIYLGWGNAGKGELRCVAEPIFNAVRKNVSHYVNNDFTHNTFYHPGYINRSYKNNPITRQVLTNFFNNPQ